STLPTYKTWTSIGCQRDSVQGRVLKHLITLSNATVEACLDACIVDNYALAGLEDGHECFCGNAILYKYPQAPACTFPCSGNSSELCGGPESLSLYQNANMPFTIGNASLLSTSGLWGEWGCNGGLLAHGPKVPIPTEEMSVERCTDGCAAAFFHTAGLERGQECFCGNITQPWPSGWESTSLFECNLPCLGNATEFCGGTLDEGRFVAYSMLPELAPAPLEWVQQACWQYVQLAFV
ncbi:WSC domain-containing protein, partial [Mycena latifolia]